MGCVESAANVDMLQRVAKIVGSLPDNFNKEQFQGQRTLSTTEESLKRFNTFSTCLNNKKTSQIPKIFNKACYICCNTYTKPEYALGPGPLNDALTVAENHKKRGYDIYYLHNPKPADFLLFLQHFLSKTKQALTVFFTGHGASVPDKDGDESDGFDEAMVFDTGYIVDDDLVVYLSKYTNPRVNVLLLTDCCHSGSIWDIQSAGFHKLKLSKNIISISAAKDDQTAKQATIGKKSQGLFTYYFWKIVNENPRITPEQMEVKIKPFLTKFKQVYVMAPTSPGIVKRPFFTS